MWKNITIAGGALAAVVAAGAAGMAASGSPGPGPAGPGQLVAQPAAVTASATATPSPSSGSATATPHHGWYGWGPGDRGFADHGFADRDFADHGMGRMLHGQWVGQDRQTGATVTYDAITGSVTAVSSSSITVKASDGFSQTYAVTSDTTVWTRTDTGASSSGIDQVKTGDNVWVSGTGTGPYTATHIAEFPAGTTD